MRILGIARLRMLTRVRSASLLFALATIPPLWLCIGASWLAENEYRAGLPFYAQIIATFSILASLIHLLVLLVGSEAGEQLHPRREGAEWSDLLETVPLTPAGRFLGEVLGNLALNVTIHACALPLLALMWVLSPIPMAVFAVFEAAAIALLSIGAAAAAWKRCATPTRWSATRMARSGLLFWILFVLILHQSARWDAFLESMLLVLSQPSAKSWLRLSSAIERPAQLTLLVALLCTSYLAFYYVSSIRGLARRRGI